MAFEFDPEKSASNAKKHGIDFDRAQQLWSDPDAITIATTYQPEDRKLLVAKIGDKVWTAVFTERSGNVRIISVRRARDNERNKYDQA